MKNFRLLRADEIECRVAQIKANGLSLLLYKDARCDMNILDETVGWDKWKKSYSRDNRNCTVSVWSDTLKEWISKEDTGTESNTEQEKGLASDSFKRACFNFGIGRELYTAPFIWIPSNACNITANGQKYACYDRFEVTNIEYDDNERISGLTIVNTKSGEIVYQLNRKKQTATETKTIGKTKAVAMAKELLDNGIKAETVCKAYKVERLMDLTESQHRNAMEHLKDLRALEEQA